MKSTLLFFSAMMSLLLIAAVASWGFLRQPTRPTSPIIGSIPLPSLGASTPSLVPTIGTPVATPSSIPANMSTTVTFTAVVSDPSLIASSVNLISVNGSIATILGQLHDDGQNGDSVAGDHVYTLVQTLNVASGQAQFEVSAAFRGMLKRVLSPLVTVTTWNQIVDPTTGLQFQVPSLGAPSQLLVTTSTNGSVILDFQLADGSKGYFSEFEIGVYNNPGHLSLNSWFEQNVDIDGLLASNGTFQNEQLSDGSSALVLTGSIPSQYSDLSGPVEQAYKLSGNGTQVISIVQSDENSLFDQGYSQAAITSLLIQVFGTVHI